MVAWHGPRCAVDKANRYRRPANPGDEKLFVGARYNQASGELTSVVRHAGARRYELSGGWFITPSVMAGVTP